MRNQAYQKAKPGIWSNLISFASKGWEIITTPSDAQCKSYYNQAEVAQEQMLKKDLSRKERRFWSKERDKAMNGLANVHETNSDTFVKSLMALGLGLLLGHRILKR